MSDQNKMKDQIDIQGLGARSAVWQDLYERHREYFNTNMKERLRQITQNDVDFVVDEFPLDDMSEVETHDMTAFTKEIIIAMLDELSELMANLPWKHWKNYGPDKRAISKDRLAEIRFELIDLQHFLNNLYMVFGMSAQDVLNYFEAKLEENEDRQRRGY